jgi:serine O-acetyltransferase
VPRRLKLPERLWYLSAALQRRGHTRLARLLKHLNAVLHHNSLGTGVSIGPNLRLEHRSFGLVVNSTVKIGRRVKIWQYVTITGSVVIEDDVQIGTHAVIITSPDRVLRIGRAARIGAGAIVTHDVPAGATIVSPAGRTLMNRSAKRLVMSDERAATEERLDGKVGVGSDTLDG